MHTHTKYLYTDSVAIQHEKKVTAPVPVREKRAERLSIKERLEAVRVDSKALIQEGAKKQAQEAKVSDHEHITKEDIALLQEVS